MRILSENNYNFVFLFQIIFATFLSESLCGTPCISPKLYLKQNAKENPLQMFPAPRVQIFDVFCNHGIALDTALTMNRVHNCAVVESRREVLEHEGQGRRRHQCVAHLGAVNSLCPNP